MNKSSGSPASAFIDGKIFAFEERFVPVHIGLEITDHVLETEAGVTFVRRLIDGQNGNVAFRFGAIPAPPHLAKTLRTKVGGPAALKSAHLFCVKGQAGSAWSYLLPGGTGMILASTHQSMAFDGRGSF
ncbi:MAG: hypothetical protein WDN50_19085 [Bradyrhizobium sp.]